MLELIDWALKLVGLAGLFFGLYLTRRHFGIVRAANFAERFNSPEMFGVRLKVDRWLHGSHDQMEKKIDALREDAELEASVRLFTNFFQELGASYRARHLDRGYVRMTFDYLVPYYWKQLAFYVKWSRDSTGNRTLYRAFGMVADEMEPRKNKGEGNPRG